MFKLSYPVELSTIVLHTGGQIHGESDNRVISIASPDEAETGSICFIWEKKELSRISKDIFIVTAPGNFPEGYAGIAVDDPRNAMINVLEYFRPESQIEPGIDSSALIEPGAVVSEDSYVGPHCVICKNTEIKAGAVLRANVYVGNGSSVGKGSRIEPGVVVYNDCSIGDDCVLHSGSVIGAEGFGFIPDGEGEPRKIPQIGGVRIGNKVEIGACTTIDRGTIGNTVIGNGVKIDNHVQVGHNVKVGNNCIIVAQTGLAGSSILEDNVIMAAKSGTSDHVRVGKGSTVAALGGVIKDISPGSVVSGFPARDHRKNFRIAALMQKLPSLFDRVKKLEKESVPSRENDNDK